MMDIGGLTLCPFSPGRPGSPSKPLSPCTSTDQCHYIATYPNHGEIGAVWRFMLWWRTLPWLLARQAFHVHRQPQVCPKTKERVKNKKHPSFTNPKACLLTFMNVTFHATVLLWDLSLQKHYCWIFLFSSAQEQISSLYPHSQLAHESGLPYWFAHERFMFISNQLGQDV